MSSSEQINKLGKLGQNIDAIEYCQEYSPSLLFAIPRILKRYEIGLADGLPIPFIGADIWNAYEISWLNFKGKPQVAIGQFVFDCYSPNIIESKSLKLYLNSLNQSKFNTLENLKLTIEQDLSNYTRSKVQVNLYLINDATVCKQFAPKNMQGVYLDRLDIEINDYKYTKESKNLLQTDSENNIEETVYSDLLKSNCLVTGQPDWASIQICYSGKAINHEGLLRYLINFRQHTEFHEQCAERIFCDIMQNCKPTKLWVYCQYTRRGGIDINPYRTNTANVMPQFIKTPRQ